MKNNVILTNKGMMYNNFFEIDLIIHQIHMQQSVHV